MQLVLIYQSQNQIIEVDSSMTINEIFLTACLTFLDTDEPADKNLGLYHRNRKITETDKTLEALQIPNHSELILANSPPRPTPETRSPQKQSQPKKQKVEDILSSAIDGLTNQTPQSASSSLPKFNFGNIKVDTSKTKESSSLKEDEIQLNKNEKREYETMFKMLQEPRMAHFRANMMQQNLKAFEALQKNSLSDFLEVYRQGKVETKLRQKKIFDVIANPDSKEAKEYLAKTKKLEAIHENFTLAMEETPEVFGSVFMLYINCKVNGRETKAFVDSGAQKTIISAKWAKHCDLDKILDDRFSGIAKGVGFQKITGRVHYATLEIEGQFLSTSFDALDGQDIDILRREPGFQIWF